MSRSILHPILLIVALCFAVPQIYGQKNLDVCRVMAGTFANGKGSAGGDKLIAGRDFEKFPVDIEEDWPDKTFRYETDGEVFEINVSINYGYFKAVKHGNPTIITLGLRVTDSKVSDSDSDGNFVEAGTSYGHKWGQISVRTIRKNIVTGDTYYQFQMTCSDGISKNVLHRDKKKLK